MSSLTKKKTRILLLTIGAVLLATILVLSGVGIYFKFNKKDSKPKGEINPLGFSIDSWDGKTVNALDFEEDYAGRGEQTKTIDSAASFVHFVNEVNDGKTFENYVIYLNSSIDLKGHKINSIGSEQNPFKGKFDGGYYTIYNASINGDGLFGYTENAEIKNVGLYNANISSKNIAGGLIGKAVNTNVSNSFVRLGNVSSAKLAGGLIGEYISNNGTHSIENSFADVEGKNLSGLIAKLDTNSSSENQLTITQSYYTQGDASVAEKVGEVFLVENKVVKAENISNFTGWAYASDYKVGATWADYDFLKGTKQLDFVYPVQTQFVKVYTKGSFYESVMVVDNGSTTESVDVNDLKSAVASVKDNQEAEINFIVEKVFVDEGAVAEDSTTIKINAVKDTTLVRGETNTTSLIAGVESSTIILGSDDSDAKLTLDGNREYVEENNLNSGSLVVAYGDNIEIAGNVVLQNNVNNTDGVGGGLLVYNANQEKITLENLTIDNCSSSTTGGGIAVVGSNVTIGDVTISNNISKGSGGGIALVNESDIVPSAKLIKNIYGNKDKISYLGHGSSSETTGYLTINAGANISGNCVSNGGGGGVYAPNGNVTVRGGDISFNECYGWLSYGGYGGGIYAGKDINIYNLTGDTYIEGNIAGSAGGGMYAVGSVSTWGCTDYNGNGSYLTVRDNQVVNEYDYDDISASGDAIYANYVSWGDGDIEGHGTSLTTIYTCSFGMSGGAIRYNTNISVYAGGINNTHFTDYGIDGLRVLVLGGTFENNSNILIGLYTENCAIRIDNGTFQDNSSSNGAFTGDNIYVNGGTFKNNVADGGENSKGSVISASKRVQIKSGTFESNSTEGNGGVIYCNGDSDDSVTIAGGTFKKNYAALYGGVIYSDAPVTINPYSSSTNILFENNGKLFDANGNQTEATNYGGVINAKNITITEDSGETVEFKNNGAEAGGAIYMFRDGEIKITGAPTFDANIAGGSYGGAICIDASNNSAITADLGNAVFSNNSSAASGGAVYLFAGMDICSLTADATFTSNSVGWGTGGAIYSYSAYTGNPLDLDGSTFTGNNAITYGGAVYHYGPTLTLNDVEFSGNYVWSTNGSGGALYCSTGLELNDCRFEFNRVQSEDGVGGGAIYVTGKTTIDKSVFYGNYTETAMGGAIYHNSTGDLTITDSGFQNNYTDKESSNAQGGGAIFVNKDAKITIDGDDEDGNGYGGYFVGNSAHGARGGAICIATGLSAVSIGATKPIRFDNNGNAEQSDTSSKTMQGGAIYSTREFSIANGTYSNNTAYYGGAIYAEHNLNISGGTFSQNEATSNGGAIYASATTISGGTFTSNEATQRFGGAVYQYGAGSVSVSNATFTNNNAYSGGAIFAGVGGNGTCRISDNTKFEGNKATLSNGGAINSSKVRISGSNIEFKNNSAKNTGGAIHTSGLGIIISGASFTSNSATTGGAIGFTDSTTNIDTDINLNNVTFQNNYSTKTSGSAYGGAIHADGATLTIGDNVKFEGNAAVYTGTSTSYYGEGGAIYLANADSTLTINGTGVEFKNNGTYTDTTTGTTYNTTSGGAIYSAGAVNVSAGTFSNNIAGSGGAIYASTTTISGGTFSGNSAQGSGSDSYGGAIYASGALTIASGVSFDTNKAGNGGAIYYTGSAKLTLGSNFTSNEAYGDGGAVYAIGEVEITGGTFSQNKATSSGGAVYANTLSGISNATFTSNESGQDGGAVYIKTTSTFTIQDSTFTTNIAKGSTGTLWGGAICVAVTSTITISNNVTFDGNASVDTSSNGVANACAGAIWATSSSITVSGTNVEFKNNGKYIDSTTGKTYYTEMGGVLVAHTLTITAGTFSNNWSTTKGAIYLSGATESSISGATFSNNTAMGDGGSIYVNAAATLTIGNNTVFDGNKADNGCAIYADKSRSTININGTGIEFKNNGEYGTFTGGAISSAGAVNVSAGTFSNNIAGSGGAIYANGTTTISGGTFSGNSAQGQGSDSYGGAIYAAGDISISGPVVFNGNAANATYDGAKGHGGAIYANANAEITGGTYSNNRADGDGGAIWGGNAGPTISISGATFTGNYAIDNGGAVYALNSMSISFEETAFQGNSAVKGGAVYIEIAMSSDNCRFTDCTFTSNYATESGGAVHINDGASITFTDSTFNLNYVDTSKGAVSGGAIYSNINTMIVGGSFTGNSVTSTATSSSYAQGGAVYVNHTGTLVTSKNSQGARVSFEGNTATAVNGVYGGAVYCCYATLADVLCQENSATATASSGWNYGGAIYVASSGTVSNSEFNGNSISGGTSYGGAIYMYGTRDNESINTSIFRNNTSTYGGAIALGLSSNYITSCSFIGNSAKNGNSISVDGDVEISGVTFESSVAADLGASEVYSEYGIKINGNVTHTSTVENVATFRVRTYVTVKVKLENTYSVYKEDIKTFSAGDIENYTWGSVLVYDTTGLNTYGQESPFKVLNMPDETYLDFNNKATNYLVVAAYTYVAKPDLNERLFYYKAAAYTITPNNYDASLMTMTGTNQATDVNAYRITITPNFGVLWADGSSNAVVLEWEIFYQPLTVVDYEGNSETVYPRVATAKIFNGSMSSTEIFFTHDERVGYTFDGWYTSASDGTQVVKPDGTLVANVSITNVGTITHSTGYWALFPTDKEVTIYEQWTPISSTVTFDSNGGSDVASKTVTYGSTYGELTQPTKEGYEFLGWAYADYTSVARTYKLADSMSLRLRPGSTDMVPYFTENTYVAFDVEFDGVISFIDILDRPIDPSDYTIVGNRVYGLTKVQPSGLIGQRSFIDLNFSTLNSNTVKFNYYFTQIIDESVVETVEDHTLKAMWQANEYTISFDSNGGSDVDDIILAYDSAYGELPAPTKEGYTLVGWERKNLLPSDVMDASSYVTFGKLTHPTVYLLPEFEAGKTYTISYTYKKVNAITFYYFYQYKDGAGTRYPGFANGYMITNNTADGNYAYQFTAEEGYQYFFYGNGTQYLTAALENITNFQIEEGSTATAYSPYVNYDGDYVTASTPVKTAANHTLKAVWKANEYTVTFDSNGGNTVSSKTVTYGEPYGELPTPTKKGHTFAGWSNNLFTTTGAYSGTIMSDTGIAYVDAANRATSGFIFLKAGTYTYIVDGGINAGNTHRYSSADESTRFDQGIPTTTTKNGVSVGVFTLTRDCYIRTVFLPVDQTAITNFDVTMLNKINVYLFKTTNSVYDIVSETTTVTTAKNHELVANWTANDYTLSFDSNGGSAVADQTVTYGGSYGTLPKPTRAGYNFLGWESKNILPFPYDSKGYDSWKINADGSIDVNVDTGEGQYSGFVFKTNSVLPAGTYTYYSGNANVILVISYAKADGTTGYYTHSGAGKTFTISQDVTYKQLYMQINPNKSVHETVYPILVKGSTTDYTFSSCVVHDGDYLADNATVQTAGNHTLRAVWEAIPTTISHTQTLTEALWWEGAANIATITAAGGSGRWIYSLVGDQASAFSLSTTSATNGSVTLQIKNDGTINAGTYKVQVMATDANNGTTATSDIITFTVNKRSATSSLSQSSFAYTGQEINIIEYVDTTSFNTQKATPGGDQSATNSGLYTFTITMNDEYYANFYWVDAQGNTIEGKVLSLNWTIGEGVINYEIWNNVEFEYAGYERGIDIVNNTETTITVEWGFDTNYGNTSQIGYWGYVRMGAFVEAGTHTVYYRLSAPNYQTVTGLATMTITPAENPLVVEAKLLSYNLSEQELVSVSNDPMVGPVYYLTDTKLAELGVTENDIMSNNMYFYEEGTTTIPTAKYAGTYTIYYHHAGYGCYEPITGKVTTTISKAWIVVVLPVTEFECTGEEIDVTTRLMISEYEETILDAKPYFEGTTKATLPGTYTFSVKTENDNYQAPSELTWTITAPKWKAPTNVRWELTTTGIKATWDPVTTVVPDLTPEYYVILWTSANAYEYRNVTTTSLEFAFNSTEVSFALSNISWDSNASFAIEIYVSDEENVCEQSEAAYSDSLDAHMFSVGVNLGCTDVSYTSLVKGYIFDGETVSIRAQVEPGFVFGGWESDSMTIADANALETTATLPADNNIYGIVGVAAKQSTYAQLNVSFDSNGGSTVADQSVTYGSAYGTLPTPTRTGYTFLGWERKNKFDAEMVLFTRKMYQISRDMSVTIVSTDSTTWESHPTIQLTPNTVYTISATNVTNFDIRRPDATEIKRGTAKSLTFTSPEDGIICVKLGVYETTYPHVAGYIQIEEGSTATTYSPYVNYVGDYVAQGTNVTTPYDHILKAVWKANTYTVTFDSNGGNAIASKTVTYDSTYGELPVPSKEGHTFAGWYTTATGSTKVENITKVTTANDHTLFAKWTINQYTLSLKFVVDGADPVDSVDGVSVNLKINGVETVSSSHSLKLDYGTTYQITGLNYDEAQYTVTVDTREFTMPAQDNVVTITLTTRTYLINIVQLSNGYLDYKGESYDHLSISGVRYGTVISLNGNVLTIGDDVVTALPVNVAGYTTVFAEWIGVENIVQFDLQIIVTFTRTANTYTLSFDSNGGSDVADMTVTYNEFYGDLPTPEKAGYTFAGWSRKNLCGGTNLQLGKVIGNAANGNIVNNSLYNTVYLEVNPGEQYAFTGFNKADGTTFRGVFYDAEKNWLALFSEDTVIVPAGAKYMARSFLQTTENVQVELGSSATEYHPYVAYEGKYVTAKTVVEIVGNHTLVANWTANQYTVSFDSNGGSEVANKTVTFGEAYGELTQPTKEGHTFLGWASKNILPFPYSGYKGSGWTDNGDGSIDVDVTTTTGVSTFHFTENSTLKTFPAGTYTFYCGNADIIFVFYYLKSDGTYSWYTYHSGSTFTTAGFNYTQMYLQIDKNTSVHQTIYPYLVDNNDFVTEDSIVSIPNDHTLTALWKVNQYDLKMKFTIDGVDATREQLTNFGVNAEFVVGGKACVVGSGSNPFLTQYSQKVDYGTKYQITNVAFLSEQFEVEYDSTEQTLGAENTTVEIKLTTKTYQLEVYLGNVSVIHSTDLAIKIEKTTAGGVETSSETLSNKEKTYISHKYDSNATYTITFTHSNAEYKYYLAVYEDEVWKTAATTPKVFTYTWVPTENHALRFGFLEDFTVKSIVGEGIEDATFTYSLYNVTYGPYHSFDYVYYGATLKFTATLKEGYEFDGWYDGDTKVSSDLVYDYDNQTVVGNVSLTAKAKGQTYNVSFDSNGGSDVEDIEVTYAGTYENLPTPTKENYKFLGWERKNLFKASTDTIKNPGANYCSNLVIEETGFTASIGTAELDDTELTRSYNGYIRLRIPSSQSGIYTLTAKYEVKSQGELTDMSNVSGVTSIYRSNGNNLTYDCEYTISLQNGCASVTYSLVYEEGITYHIRMPLCGNTVRYYDIQVERDNIASDYTPYVNYDGDYVTTSTTVATASDHKLVAVWERETISVSFNTNGGNEIESKTYTIGDTYGELPKPEKPGYTFVGWTGKNLLSSNVMDYSSYVSGYGRTYPTVYKLPFIEAGKTYTISIGYERKVGAPYYYIYKYTNGTASALNYMIKNTTTSDVTYTFTAQADTEYFFYGNGVTSLRNALFNIKSFQIEEGNTATAYEPYIVRAGQYVAETDTIVSTEDLVLRAVWEEIPTTITSEVGDNYYYVYGKSETNSHVYRITAGGGGGKWIYEFVYETSDNWNITGEEYFSFSETEKVTSIEATGPVNLYFISSVAEYNNTYECKVKATSVYNDTYAITQEYLTVVLERNHIPGPIEIAEENKVQYYTGEEINILNFVTQYDMYKNCIEVSGDYIATEPGTYSFTLTPDEDHMWAWLLSHDPITFEWSIKLDPNDWISITLYNCEGEYQIQVDAYFKVGTSKMYFSPTPSEEDDFETLDHTCFEGYTFLGYYKEDTDILVINPDKTLVPNIEGITSADGTWLKTAQRLTLEQRCKANSYTVSFDANGADEITSTIDVTYGSTYGELPTPTRTGYTFMGWAYKDYTSTATRTKLTDSNALRLNPGSTWKVADFTENTYVAFDVEFAEGNVLSSIDILDQTIDPSNYTVVGNRVYGMAKVPNTSNTAGKLNKYSYVDLNFSTYVSNSITFNYYFTQIIEDSVVEATSDHTLKAMWKINQHDLNVKFTIDGVDATESEIETYDLKFDFKVGPSTSSGIPSYAGIHNYGTTYEIAGVTYNSNQFEIEYVTGTQTLTQDTVVEIKLTKLIYSITLTYSNTTIVHDTDLIISSPECNVDEQVLGYNESITLTHEYSATSIKINLSASNTANEYYAFVGGYDAAYINWDIFDGKLNGTINWPVSEYVYYSRGNYEIHIYEMIDVEIVADDSVTVDEYYSDYVYTPTGAPTNFKPHYAPYMTVYLEATPDEDYEFDGWYVDGEKVSSETMLQYILTDDVTIEAKTTPKKYTVTWIYTEYYFYDFYPDYWWDQYYENTIHTSEVAHGEVPVYDGPEFSKTQETPDYAYTFAGWAYDSYGSQMAGPITGDTTLYTYYEGTQITYTITWVDEDGTVLEEDKNCTYYQALSYDGPTPTKQADAQYTYSFAGWKYTGYNNLEFILDFDDIWSSCVTGNATYTAAYSKVVNNYTITWVDEDGTELDSQVLAYGTMPEYSGDTPTKVDPTGQYVYTFAGWAPEVVSVTGNATYTAVYTNVLNKFNVTFTTTPNGYGSVSETQVEAIYGSTISVNANKFIISFAGTNKTITATPASSSGGYNYSFGSWSVTSGKVEGDIDVTVTFERDAIDYLITYKGLEGATITENPKTFNVETAPFKLNNPTLAGYEFAGWIGANGTVPSKDVTVDTSVIGDKEFKAVWFVDVEVNATGAESGNSYGVKLYDKNDNLVETYTSSFQVIKGNVYTLKVFANVKSDSSNNEYQILKISLDGTVEFTVPSPKETSITDSTLGTKAAINKKIVIGFEYLDAYMMTINMASNSIAGLTITTVNNKNNTIVPYTSANSYIIAKGTTVTFTVDSTPISTTNRYTYIGFKYVVDGVNYSTGVRGGTGIAFNNFTHNTNYADDADVGKYTYTIASNVEISSLTINTIVTTVVTINTEEITSGTITLKSEHGFNKVIDANTKSVILYTGEWLITETTLDYNALVKVFKNYTIKSTTDGYVVVV